MVFKMGMAYLMMNSIELSMMGTGMRMTIMVKEFYFLELNTMTGFLSMANIMVLELMFMQTEHIPGNGQKETVMEKVKKLG